MENAETRDFFTDPELANDPYPWIEAMRAKCPVARETFHNTVVVTGFDEVVDVYSRPQDFSNVACVGGPLAGLPFHPEGDDISAEIETNRDKFHFSDHFITFDGDPHRAYRSLMTRLLTFKRLKANEAFVATFANQLIDRFKPQGSCEFISQFAQPLATMVIADLLGVPAEDRDELHAKIQPAPGGIDQAAAEPSADPFAMFEEIFSAYLRDRRTHPRDDMLTELAHAKLPDGSDPGVDALVRVASFLFIGGQDTSAKLLASGVRIIAEQPEIQRQLREDRSKIGNFIEEVLRIESPTINDFRLTRRTTTIAGVEVKAGTMVMMSLSGANRDPRVFERPAEFDMNRPKLRDHVSFGRGPHACPGAPLARIEAKVGIEQLFNRFTNISIDEERHGSAQARNYRYLPSYILRGLEELHLRLQA